MGIDIETPDTFIEDFRDPIQITKILRRVSQIRKSLLCTPRVNPKDLSESTPLIKSILKAQEWLLQKRDKNYWNGEVEAHAGLNAQFILLAKALGIADNDRLAGLHSSIMSRQNSDGLWPIYYGGQGHLTTTLLSYLAGRAMGYSPDSPELRRAKDFIRQNGGPDRTNNECKFILSIYGLYDWKKNTPISPLLALIPHNAEFSIYSTGYWIRISLMPMSIIGYNKYTLSIPGLRDISELYPNPDTQSRESVEDPRNAVWKNLIEDGIPDVFSIPRSDLERLAIKKIEHWILAHQDESGDWGGIYPPMQYSVLALHSLGYPLDHPVVDKGIQAMIRFQTEKKDGILQQSCVSPVWDTGWALLALRESCYPCITSGIPDSTKWLVDQQIMVEGDWAIRNKTGLGGGWAFQFANNYYPDIDDSAVVLMALLKTPFPESIEDKGIGSILLGLRWILTMQNHDGGWSAFEQGVDDEYVNTIPLNDMNNWLDSSTDDVTGRCLQLLGISGCNQDDRPVGRAVQFLSKNQTESGAWFGRWGVNYIYGTWSVLMGLKSVGLSKDYPIINKASLWLEKIQQPDGGWGESPESYDNPELAGRGTPTPSQTAWAVSGLIAAGQGGSEAVRRGIEWLVSHQNVEGTWEEPQFTGTGFPCHFYLRYDLYRHYFPLLALGEYFQYIEGR